MKEDDNRLWYMCSMCGPTPRSGLCLMPSVSIASRDGDVASAFDTAEVPVAGYISLAGLWC